jgi:hypothetical protein
VWCQNTYSGCQPVVGWVWWDVNSPHIHYYCWPATSVRRSDAVVPDWSMCVCLFRHVIVALNTIVHVNSLIRPRSDYAKDDLDAAQQQRTRRPMRDGHPVEGGGRAAGWRN